ncbi:MAG: MlaA family lipoprotein, partial [Pseudomonadales bacterium]
MRDNIRRVMALCLLALASGCATTADVDPYENLNRPIMEFNDSVDSISLQPIAQAYVDLIPKGGRKVVRNFFANLAYPNVVINQFLQGKVKMGVSDTVRFLLNTTIGIGGLFDVATRWGLAAHYEDFGQTFAAWGVSSGPYLVVPFWGPVTARDAIGDLFDALAFPTYYLNDVVLRNSLTAGWAVDRRAAVLEAETLIGGDRYLFIRDAYLQHREFL